jgi:hypothetical protein
MPKHGMSSPERLLFAKPSDIDDGCVRMSASVRAMISRFAIVGVSAIACLFASAATGNTLMGDELLAACEARDAAQHGFCLGYIRGVAEVHVANQATTLPNWEACLPPVSATAGLVGTTVVLLRKSPELRNGSAYVAVMTAVQRTFPCQ